MTSDDTSEFEPAGWYHAEGDPPTTVRYWNGSRWESEPVIAPGAASTVLATPINRIGGVVLDLIIVFFVAAFAVGLIAGDALLDWNETATQASELGQPLPEPPSGVVVILGLTAFVWEAGWIVAIGAPPGMRIFGALVADARQSAIWTRATVVQALLRSSGRLLLGLSGFVPLLASFVLLFGLVVALVSVTLLFADNERRTILDRVARTRVISASAMGTAR